MKKLFTSETIKKAKPNEIWFQGTTGIRKCGVNYIFSFDELSHYAKCFDNVKYLIEKNITYDACSPNGRHQFLRGFQIQMLEDLKNNRFVIFNLARQLGFSLILNNYVMSKLLYNNNFNILYVSSSSSNLEKLFNIYKQLPYYLKCGIINYNTSKGIIKFENGSFLKYVEVKNSKKVENIGISHPFNIVIFESASYIKNLETLYTNIIPTISSNSNSQLIISNDMYIDNNGNDFISNIIEGSKKSINDPEKNVFKYCEYPWYILEKRKNTYIKFKSNTVDILKDDIIKFLNEKFKLNILVSDDNLYDYMFSYNEYYKYLGVILDCLYDDKPISDYCEITNYISDNQKMTGQKII